MEHQTICNTCETQVLSFPSLSAVKKLLSNGVLARGVTRSLVLTGHLLYASSLALHLRRVLHARLHDMNGTNMMLWLGMCPARPARPGLCYTTGSSNLKLNTFSCTCYRYYYIFNFYTSIALRRFTQFVYCPAPVSENVEG